MTARLRQYRNLQTTSPETVAELIESTLLPLFDFRRMTQLAMGRNWRLAQPGQQDTLIVEFRTLLVRTHSTALTNYRDQTIEYQALRVESGVDDVTVKSIVKQSGADPTTIDYAMEKTMSGWKVYEIRITGISLVTTYRSTFAQLIRDGGIDGLIASLATKNRQAESGLNKTDSSDARSSILLYTVMPGVLRSAR